MTLEQTLLRKIREAYQAWERAGRMDIMVSHRVGHK